MNFSQPPCWRYGTEMVTILLLGDMRARVDFILLLSLNETGFSLFLKQSLFRCSKLALSLFSIAWAEEFIKESSLSISTAFVARRDGLRYPVSHWDTVSLDTPKALANSCWVIPSMVLVFLIVGFMLEFFVKYSTAIPN